MTVGGAIEGIVRLITLGICSWVLYRIYQNPVPLYRSANDALIGGLVLLVALFVGAYQLFRLLNVFFQKMEFENGVLTIRFFLREQRIPRKDFDSLWVSCNTPKGWADYVYKRSIRSLWLCSIGFDGWKSDQTFTEGTIGKAWDPAEVDTFVKLVNHS